MRITKCYLENFGKFQNTYLDLSQDMTVIYGENEYGKSTLYTFIKAMLFGMERGRGKAAGKDEFTRYRPLVNPNNYGGVMWFTCGGRHFRLERHFDPYGKSTFLFCEDDGEELSVADGDLDMLLEGMNVESFENTAAIGRLTAEPGKQLAEELRDVAANYSGTGSGQVRLQNAFDSLKARKKEIQKDLQAIKDKRENAKQELRIQQRYLEEEQEKLIRQQDALDDQPVAEEPTGNLKAFLPGILLILLGAAGLIWRLLSSGNGGWILGIFLLLIFAGVLFTVLALLRIQRGKREAREAEDRRKWEMGRLKEEWDDRSTELHNLKEQWEELDQPDEAEIRLEDGCEAVDLASDRIRQAAEEMNRQFGEQLNQKTSEIFAAITSGKYRQVKVDDQLEIVAFQGDQRLSALQLSRGTLEQLYFALRMAALDLLYDDFPVIIDDAFVFYDDERLDAALNWLSGQSRQVILFSCQTREKAWIDRQERET